MLDISIFFSYGHLGLQLGGIHEDQNTNQYEK